MHWRFLHLYVVHFKSFREHASGIYNTMKEIEKLIAYEKVMDEGEEKTQ